MKNLLILLSFSVMAIFMTSAVDNPQTTSCTVTVNGAPTSGVDVIASVYNAQSQTYSDFCIGRTDSSGVVIFTNLIVGQTYGFRTVSMDGWTQSSSSGHVMKIRENRATLNIQPIRSE